MEQDQELRDAIVFLAKQGKGIAQRLDALERFTKSIKAPVKGVDYVDGMDAPDPTPIIEEKISLAIPSLKKESEAEFESKIPSIAEAASLIALSKIKTPKDGENGKDAPDPTPIIEKKIEKESKSLFFAIETKMDGMIEKVVNQVLKMIPTPVVEVRKEKASDWDFEVIRDGQGFIKSIKAKKV